MLHRFAKAWVRLNLQSDLRTWTEQELLDVFCLLPTPPVNPKDWLDLRQALDNPPAATPKLMTTDEILEQNALNIEGAKQDAILFPGFVKVG